MTKKTSEWQQCCWSDRLLVVIRKQNLGWGMVFILSFVEIHQLVQSKHLILHAKLWGLT